MSLVASLIMLQTGVSANQPGYFVAVLIGSLILGGVGWLVAAVMGFARARAFGASTRWFSLAAVCLLIYHIQFLLLGFLAVAGRQLFFFNEVPASGIFFLAFLVILPF